MSTELPLSGIRVLELSHAVMGPTTGLILADLGAEVVKIEPAPRGDETRQLKGFGAGFFPFFNRNKLSLAVNLKCEEGKAVLTELIKKADVLVENFGPGTIDRLGFGWETLRDINPRLIFCSLKGFMPGPYEKRPALDEVVQMMGGLAYMTGPQGRPLRAGASVVDILGGSYGAIAVLTALHEREKSGRGRFVRATLFESTALLMAQHMAVAAVTGQAPPPMPERNRSWSVYDLFETADGEQVFIGVTSDRHWARFCEAFGFPDLAADERLATNQSRVDAREWLMPKLMTRLRTMSQKEIMGKAEKAGIPFAPIAQPVDLFEDPHLNEAGWLLETRLMDGRMTKLPKLPLSMEGLDFGVRNHAPEIGTGGRKVLKEAGYSDEEVDRLNEAGILEAR